jgi:hypothetical protein
VIVEVFEGPTRPAADGIFVTPTMVAQLADKRMMMVGDLSDGAALGPFMDAALAKC